MISFISHREAQEYESQRTAAGGGGTGAGVAETREEEVEEKEEESQGLYPTGEGDGGDAVAEAVVPSLIAASAAGDDATNDGDDGSSISFRGEGK